MESYKEKIRVMTKFSSAPVFKALIRDKNWIFLGEKRLMGKMQTGELMDRKTGFREMGIKTYSFEYIG